MSIRHKKVVIGSYHSRGNRPGRVIFGTAPVHDEDDCGMAVRWSDQRGWICPRHGSISPHIGRQEID